MTDAPGVITPPSTAMGRGYTVGSFVLAVLAVAVVPPLLGLSGAVLGFIGGRKGDPLGFVAMVTSLAAIAIGLAIGAVFFMHS